MFMDVNINTVLITLVALANLGTAALTWLTRREQKVMQATVVQTQATMAMAQTDIRSLEVNTNSMREQLVAATARASRLVGTEEGRQESQGKVKEARMAQVRAEDQLAQSKEPAPEGGGHV